jgi:hypothetical protein
MAKATPCGACRAASAASAAPWPLARRASDGWRISIVKLLGRRCAVAPPIPAHRKPAPPSHPPGRPHRRTELRQRCTVVRCVRLPPIQPQRCGFAALRHTFRLEGRRPPARCRLLHWSHVDTNAPSQDKRVPTVKGSWACATLGSVRCVSRALRLFYENSSDGGLY